MRKLILAIIICFAFTGIASAQLPPVLPSFQFGIKGGVNMSAFPQNGIYNNSNQVGYVAGIWARIGALGFNFQPEVYLAGKDVKITDNNGNINKARFTSLDVPLLFGGKIGAFGIGGRFYTGPMVSFAINNDQSLSDAAKDVVKLDYKNQNYAWQFGAGLDIQKLSIDLRYEAGLNKIAYGPQQYSHTRINLFNLTLAYRLFAL